MVEHLMKAIVWLHDAIATQEAENQPIKGNFASYSPLERKIALMLVENTGVAMLDSGCAYGRNWQRNRKVKDFKERPVLKVEVGQRYVSFELDVFHFLVNSLAIDEETEALDIAFEQFARNRDGAWLVLMEDFAEEVMPAMGYRQLSTFNTANGEDLLSQVLQGILYSKEEDWPALVHLQIHGGCDIRGGYTAPKFFSIPEDSSFFKATDLIALCGCEEPYFSDNCGYDWYPKLEVKIKENKVYCKKCGKIIAFEWAGEGL